MKLKSHLLFLFFSFYWFGFSQQDVASIDLVDFNNSVTYGSGSGVTVHFNPKGVYKFDNDIDDNQFFLELSDADGMFPATPTILSTVDGFFITTINGIIPADSSGNYRLRVRASKGLLSYDPTNPQIPVYGEVISEETALFSVTEASVLAPVVAYSRITPNANKFDCTVESNFDYDPTFGLLTLSSGQTSDEIGSTNQRKILISNVNSNSEYTIRKIDVINDVIETSEAFTQTSSIYYVIPDDIGIGTYNYEIQELDNDSGLSSTYTIVLILHRSTTTLGNNSSENVCVDTDVIFNIDTSSSGIGENYNGSYYEFDFGDGSDIEIFTHAEILANPELIHFYQDVSCNFDPNYFELKKRMYNKYNSNEDESCMYQPIGNGVTKLVNTSKSPDALISSTDICENQNIVVNNLSTLGEYGLGVQNCDDGANFYWKIMSPSGTLFDVFIEDGEIEDPNNWLIDTNSDGLLDIVIPSSTVEPGCWGFRLFAVNQDLCNTESVYPPLSEPRLIVNVDAIADADFEFLDENDQIITEICFGQPVTFENTSNVLDYDCQSPNYTWTISPDNGYNFVDPFTENSQSPDVIFNVPGVYDITLTVSNICGESSIPKSITILGDPTVDFINPSLAVCENINEFNSNGYTLDFSNPSIAPNYSSIPYEPTSFIWTVTGGNEGIDYTFDSTFDQNSQFPIIYFSSFGEYVISVQVNGNCTGSNNADFSFVYDQTPIIENNDLLQELCSGDQTQEVVYSSDMPSTTYMYTITADAEISGYEGIDFSNGIPEMTLINSPPSNVTNSLIITVTPTVDNCSGESLDFVYTINPRPVIPPQTAVICSGDDLTISGATNAPPVIVPIGTTYTWTVISADSGIQNAISSADLGPGPYTDMLIQTGANALENDLDVVQFVRYSVTPTSGADGNCVGESFDIIVQVDPVPTISSVTLDPICSGEGFTYDPATDINNIVPTGTLYEWTVSAAGSATGFTNQGPNGVSSITQANLEVQDVPVVLTYTVTPYAPGTNGNRCPGDSFDITIQVNPKPVIPPQTAVICSGDDLTISGATNAPPVIVPIGTTYTWTVISADSGIQNAISSADLGPGPYTDMLIQTGANALENDLDVVQFVRYSVTPTSGADGNCVGESFDIIVQVDPVPTISSVTLDPICSGEGFTYDPATDINNIVPTGTLYEWTVSAAGSATGFTNQGPNGVSSITQANLEVQDVPVVLTYTVTPYAPGTNGNRCPGDSFDITIQVNPKPVIPPQTAVICSGDDLTISGATNAPPVIVPIGTTYTWTVISADSGIQNAISSADLGPGPYTDMLIQTGANALENDLDVVQFVRYSVTPTSGADGNCVGESFDIIVQVDPVPTISSVTLDPICSGEGFTYDPATDINNIVPTGTLYEWTVSAAGSATGFTNQGPNGVSSITQANLEVQDVPVVLTYTVTPYAPGTNGNRCPGDSFDITIQVNPMPVMDAIDSQTICSGTEFETPVYNSDVAGVTYSWTLLNTNIPSDITGYPQSITYPVQGQLTGVAIENNINPPESFTLEYEITVNFDGCEGNTVPFFITINPAPIISISPSNPQSICDSGGFDSLTVSYDYPDTVTPSFQWWYNGTTNTNDTTHPDAVLVTGPGSNTSTYTPQASDSGTKYYFCVISFSSLDLSETVCNDVASPTVKISVENQPSISTNPEPEQTVCLGGNLPEDSLCITVDGGVEPIQYTWRAGFDYLTPEPWGNFPSIVSGESNCLTLPDDFFDNTLFEDEEIFFWVIISFPDGNGCGIIISEPSKVTVIVDPVLTDPSPSTQEICADSAVDCLVGTADGGIGNYTFEWYEQGDPTTTLQTDSNVLTSTFCPPSDVSGSFEYYYVVTTDATDADCETTSLTAEVIVTPSPTISSQPIVTQTVCEDGVTQSLEVSYINGVGTPTYQWYSTTVCDTADLSQPIASPEGTASSYTPPSTLPGTMYYFAVLTFADGGCDAITSDCAEVVVVPDPEVNITGPLAYTICIDGEIGDIETTVIGGVGTPTYTWFRDGTAVASGLGLTTYNPTSIEPTVFGVSGDYEFFVEVSFTGSGCDLTTSETVLVTVISDPVLTDPSPSTQEICADSAVDCLVGTADGGIGNYTFEWYEQGDPTTTLQTDSNVLTSTFCPPSDVSGSFEYYYVVTTDATDADCETTSLTAEVIVTPSPTISSQPIVTQTVCEDGVTQSLEVSYINGVGTPTYQWYSTTVCDTADLSQPIASPEGTASSYTPPSTLPGTMYYFAVLTFADGGCDAITSDCAEVVVVPDPEVNITGPLAYTICIDGEIGDIETTVIGGVGTPTYTWFRDGTAVASGLGLTTYNPTSIEPTVFGVSGDYEFFVEVSFTGSGCDLTTSETVLVTVISDPVLTDPSPSTQEICADSAVDCLVGTADGGIGNYTFEWYEQGDPTTTLQTDSNVLTSTFCPPSDVSGSFEYYYVVTTDATDADCETTSLTAEVIVTPSPTISSQPIVTQTVCEDGVTQSLEVSYINGVGTPTYQWYSTTVCDTADLSQPIASPEGTASSYTPPSTLPGTMYYFAVLTFADGGCDAITSDCAEVVVVPDPEVNITGPLAYTICIDGEIGDIETTVIGGVGTPTYTWFRDGTAVASGLGLTTYNPTSIEPTVFGVSGDYEFFVEVSFTGSGCDLTTSETVLVTVISDPVLTDPSPSTQEICADSAVDCLVGTADGGIGNYTFEWYEQGDPTTTLQTDSNVLTSTFCPPSDVSGSFEYYYVVTTDATDADCETTSLTAEVIVTPSPTISSQPIVTQTVCEDGVTQSLEVSYINGVGTPTYQWYSTTVCDTADLSQPIASPEGTASSYTPPSTLPGTMYYFAVLTFADGGCDAITSDCAEVVVVPDPEVNITGPLAYTICIDGEIGDIETTVIGGVGTPTYTWFRDGTAVASGLGLTTYNPTSIEPTVFGVSGDYEFFVEVSFTGSGCDLTTSETVLVTVISDPVLTDPSPSTQEICADSAVDCLVGTADGGIGNYTFEWYEQGDPTTTLQTDSNVLTSTFCPPSDVSGSFEYYYVVTTDATDADCETTSLTAEVIVTPSPTISSQPIVTQTVCEDGVTQSLEVSYINGVGTPTYQWYSTTVCDTADLSQPIASPEGTASSYTPPSTLPGTMYYFAVLTFADGGCDAITSDCAEVVVKPVAVIPDVNDEICDLSSFTLNPQNGLIPDLSTVVPTGTTYTWTFTDNINVSGESSVPEALFPDGFGAPNEFDSGILDNINPLFNVIETVTFEVTPWTDGCSGSPFNITIAVNPKPLINEVITNIACSYSNPLCGASIEISPVGIGPFTYSWVSIEGNPLNDPTDEDQFDLCPGTYELTITDVSSCSYVFEYEIVPPVPVEFTLITQTDISCNNVNTLPCDGSIEVSTTGGTLPYNLVEWYTETIPGSGVFDSGPLINIINPYNLVNACEGNYVLKILDANGCEFVSDVYTIEQAVEPIILTETLSNYNGFNIDCNAANSGTITVDISGGSGVFIYSFVDAIENVLEADTILSSPATLVFDFLISGDYTLTVEDPNCTDQIIRNYTLTQPDELVITATLVDPIECFNGLATYDVTATGGVPPYTGTGLQSVLSGPVTFIVSDANGCEDDFSTVVNEPAELLATYVVDDAPCFEDTGQIIVTPTGGTGVLTVNLYDNNNIFITSLNTTQGNSVTFDQLAETYFYDVVDENNCSYGPEVVLVDEPDPIIVTDFEVVQPDCNTVPAWEFNNGSICITITGGTNPFPIGTGWVDNGGGQWCLNNLSAGTYPIDVTDINNCLLQNSIPDITLVRPPEITAVLTNTTDIDCDTDTATQINTIIVNGGVPPYQITWSGGIVDAANPFVMETSVPGNYSAFVIDQYGLINGCPPIEFPLDPITFFDFGIADFTLSSDNSAFCGIYAINDPIQFNNISTGDIVSYNWDFGDGSPEFNGPNAPDHTYNAIGTYTISLTVEDLYGCFDTYSETIEITKGYEIILPNGFTPNGDGINETIRPVTICMTEIKMSIYDTWGSLIYAETSDDIYGWDGTIDGKPAENGNYIMVVIATTYNGAVIELNGPVTLIK